MDKRTFLKLCSAVSTPVLSPLLAWAQGEALKNWAGNVTYGTERLTTATSLKSVQDFVREHNKFKVLGTRHCFNGIADSSDQFLSLKAMNEVVALDPDARTVTVEAGMSYGQLCPYLDSKGWALPNLASLPHISIVGACMTATHGSGEKNGNLATAVSTLEFVDANGNVVQLSRQQDGDRFRGAVVGLGGLGVVTKITLDIQPRFTMQQYVYQNLPLKALTSHFDALESAAYSVSLFTDWRNETINQVWLKIRMESGRVFDVPQNSTERRGRPKIFTLSSRFPRRTARNRWEFWAPGTSGCPTFGWALPRALAKSCNRNTSFLVSTQSRQFSRYNACMISLVRTCSYLRSEQLPPTSYG